MGNEVKPNSNLTTAPAATQATAASSSDEEIIQNLDLLMNLDSLEQVDEWDFLIQMAELQKSPKAGDKLKAEEN